MSRRSERNHTENVEGREADLAAGSACGAVVSQEPARADAATRKRGRVGPQPRACDDGKRCGGDESGPPSVTNRGVPKFQGSEDTIELAAYIKWDNEWADVCRLLDECKAAAAEEGEGEAGFFDLGGWECEVMPNGSKSGKSGPYRAYVIHAVGLRFEFGRASEPKGDCPNGKIIAGSLACMQLGAAGVLALAKEFIEAMGGVLVANKVSRIDGAIDLPGVNVSEFIDPWQQGRTLCRATRHKLEGEHGRHQTLYLGQDPMVRFYDKLAELRNKPDAAKQAFLIANRWGGTIPEHATRVEFQLRRDALKSMTFVGALGEEMRIDSLEDYLQCREGVWRYMCRWFRLTQEVVDENHRDRATTLPLWLDVEESFAAWASSPAKAITRAKRTPSADLAGLRAQSLGCMIAEAAATCDRFDGRGQFIHLAATAAKEAIESVGEEDLQRKWLKKRRAELARQVPDRDRRPHKPARRYPFNTWLADQRAYEAEVKAAGGQLPIRWREEPFQFLDLSTMVGD